MAQAFMTDRPPRLLMIVSGYPPAKKAGMERGCQRLAEALARRGHEVAVLTQWAKGLAPQEEPMENLRIERRLRPLALGPLWGATYMLQVGREMRRLAGEWDVCVCHKLDLHSAMANRTARRLGKRSLHLLVNSGEFGDMARLARHKGGGLLLKKAIQADGFFSLSRLIRGELLEAGVSESRIRPYRYFVDTEAFRPKEEQRGGEFLFLGRLHPQKNLHLLIEAFELLHADHPEARLRMVGDGPERPALEAHLRASPARETITLDRWTDEPAAALRRARALVISSRSEGLSNTMVEALACGTPVVTTDVSGARDALSPDEELGDAIPEGGYLEAPGGLLVGRDDAPGLKRAMQAILLDEELARKISAEARRIAENHFSEDAAVEMFLEGIGALCPEAGGRW